MMMMVMAVVVFGNFLKIYKGKREEGKGMNNP